MSASNIIGHQVRRLRMEKGWTQEVFSARCGVRGWDVSRGTLAKIEARLRCVSDAELWMLAETLGCELESLYPNKRAPILAALSRES